jgi:hypothetical protein
VDIRRPRELAAQTMWSTSRICGPVFARRAVAIALGLAVLGFGAGPAFAQSLTGQPPTGQPTAPVDGSSVQAEALQPPLRSPLEPEAPVEDASARKGFVLQLTAGLSLGATAGYPAGPKFKGVPELYGSTPLLVGGGFRIGVLAALHRMFNVGFFGGFNRHGNAAWKNIAGGFGLRLELFPFAASSCGCRTPSFIEQVKQNLGVYGDFGIGSVSTDVIQPPAGSGKIETIGGVQALVAGGVFYEFRLGKNFILGPDLRYEVVTTSNAAHNAFSLGLRVAWYPGRD